ncbi:hypothetical protein L3Y34_004298 [Caenorhabditis briggsae]|nr:hypothetical protein L3Y34_004298 [Caenorhabditis briggsae]
MSIYELCCDMIDVTLDLSSIYGVSENGSNYDERSSSVIRLKSEQIMFLRQVNKHLALVFIMKEDGNEKAGFIDHNFGVFKAGIEQVFKVKNRGVNF